MDKFSYYDTLSNLIPGIIFLWALSVLGPFSQNGLSLILTGDAIVDSILLLAVGYTVGHLLQFLSKFSIEKIIKQLFWNGYFFSEIFLVAGYRKCNETELNRYLAYAENELKIEKESINLLRDPATISDEAKRKVVTGISQMIYRTIDARSSDTIKGQKAQLQNNFYSFFRNFAMVFFILGILDLLTLVFHPADMTLELLGIIIINFLLTGIFLYQAKQRGEYYVKGLFWSNA